MNLDAAATLALGIDTGPANRALLELESRLNRLGVGSFRQSTSATHEFESRIRTLQAEVDRLSAAKGRATANTTRYTNGLSRATAATNTLTESSNMLHSAFRGIGGTVGGLWMTYAKYVSVMVSAAAVTKTFYDSISRGMNADFQSQFVSLFQTQGKLDLGLKDQILTDLIAVSRESVFTVTENANAMTRLALAGVDATTSIGLLTTATNAAIFSQTSLEEATTRVLDTVNNFGLVSQNPLIMADSFKRVANVMTIAASTVNATFTDIAKSFENLTGVAEAFNIKIEESAVLLQSLARAGVRGPKAGTYLRNFFDDLLGAPISKRAEATLADLGIERYDPDNYASNEFGAVTYIDNLVASLKQLDFVEQQNAIRAISNQRSRRVLRQEIVATNTALERTIELEKLAMADDGALVKMVAGLQQNARMRFQMAQAAYDAAVTSGFSGNQDLFAKVGDDLRVLFNSATFADFTSWGARNIGELAGSLTDLLKWVVENRKALEYFGNAIIWLASGAVVGALIASLTALRAHPVLGVISAFLVLASAAEKNLSTGSIDELQSRLETLKAVLENTKGLPQPVQLGLLYVMKQIQDGIKEANDGIKVETRKLEDEFQKLLDLNDKYRLEEINYLASQATTNIGIFGESESDRTYVALNALENRLDSLQWMAAEFQEAIDQIKGDPALEGTVKIYQEEFQRLGQAIDLAGNNADKFRKRWENMVLSQGMPEGMVNLKTDDLAERNSELEKEIELLELGREGIHKKNMMELEHQLAIKRTTLSMIERQLVAADDAGDTLRVQRLLREANLVSHNIYELERNIKLSQTHFDLEGRKNERAKDLTNTYDTLVQKLKDYHDAQMVEAGFVEELTGYQQLHNEVIQKFGQNLEKATPAQREVLKGLLEHAKAAENVNSVIQKSIKAQEAWNKFVDGAIKPLSDATSEIRKLIEAEEDLNVKLLEGQDIHDERLRTRELDEIKRLDTIAGIYDEAKAMAALNAQWDDYNKFAALASSYKEQADLSRRLYDLKEANAIADQGLNSLIENLRIVDQSFKQFYDDLIERNGNAWDNLKNNAKRMFFDWLYKMTVQRWVINIGASFTGASPAALAQMMGGGAGGYIPGASGMGGGGFFNPMSFLSSSSMLQGVGGSLMQISANTGISSLGDLGFNLASSGIPNWHLGIAGALGGLAGSALFGGQGFSGMGGSIGSMAGYALGGSSAAMLGSLGAAAGPIGAIAGMLLGSALGSLFGGGGERFERHVASNTGTYANGKYTSLGEDPDYFPGAERFGSSATRTMSQLNKTFTERLGALLDAFGIDSSLDVTSRARLRRTSGRVAAGIFGAFEDGSEFEFKGQYGKDGKNLDEAFAQFVNDALTQGIAAAIRASQLPAHIKNIFEEELGNDQIDAAIGALVGVADMKARLEAMPEIFTRLAHSINTVLNSDNYDDLMDQYDQLNQLNEAMKVYYDSFIPISERFTDQQRMLRYEFDQLGFTVPKSIADFKALADGLDLTTAEGRELFVSLMNLAPGFMEVVGAIEAARAVISDTTAKSIRDIELSILDNQGKYRYIDNEIYDLLEKMNEANDPATIRALYEQINRLTMDAYNLLDDEQKKAKAGEFIDLLRRLEDDAQDRLDIIGDYDPADTVDAISDAMVHAVEVMVERMEVVSNHQQEAAENLARSVTQFGERVVDPSADAALMMRQAAILFGDAVNRMPDAISISVPEVGVFGR